MHVIYLCVFSPSTNHSNSAFCKLPACTDWLTCIVLQEMQTGQTGFYAKRQGQDGHHHRSGLQVHHGDHQTPHAHTICGGMLSCREFVYFYLCFSHFSQWLYCMTVCDRLLFHVNHWEIFICKVYVCVKRSVLYTLGGVCHFLHGLCLINLGILGNVCKCTISRPLEINERQYTRQTQSIHPVL